MPKTLSPIETFLAPLAKLAAKHHALEGEVIWAKDGDWQPHDDDTEFLDAEEAVYYAEGLLLEGFHLHYQVLAESDAPKDPAHIRLFFWQSDPPSLPKPEAGLLIFSANTWAG